MATTQESPDPPAQTSQTQSPPADLMERVLVFAPTGRDGPLVTESLSRAGFVAFLCRSIEHFCEELGRGAGAAFVAEEALVGDGVSCVIDVLRKQPAWSDVPVILMTSGGKTTQYSERIVRSLESVSNLTLLERPLRILTLISAIHAALRARRRQYEVRSLLQEKEDAVRHRDQFLAMLGHELRNPLAAIRTAVEVVAEFRMHLLAPAGQVAPSAQTARVLMVPQKSSVPQSVTTRSATRKAPSAATRVQPNGTKTAQLSGQAVT